MKDLSKRLKQTTIVLTKKTPTVEGDVTDANTDSDEDANPPLPNVDIYAKIYAYCEVATAVVGADAYPQYDPAVHGRPVYVGQTIQELKTRDKQHLLTRDTVFDRQYRQPSQYIMALLTKRRFAAAAKDEDFTDDTLHPAGAWMDYWETKYISEFDTFVNGFNRTKGGQGSGWLVAMREAKAFVMYERFLNTYMPAFRKYYEETGKINAPRTHTILGPLINHIRMGHTQVPPQFEEELRSMGLDTRNQHIVQRDRRWEEENMPAFRKYYEETGKTHVNAPYAYAILGPLINHIRMGHTQVPPQFEEELRSMGLDTRNQIIVQRDGRWEEEYMPAFRKYYEETGKTHVNAPYAYAILGPLINHIRTGHTQVPPQFEEELRSMGLDTRNQIIVQRDRRWEEEYMPAFRKYYEETGKTHVNAPYAYAILGTLINSIRTGHTQVPPQFEEELRSMGLDTRNQHIVQRDRRWEEENMPAFRKYYEETGKTHVNAPQTYPILGPLINHIRTGHTQVPPQFEEELRSMAFFWCTANLARHVMRVLKRAVESLYDAEAKKVVGEAVMEHSRLLTHRQGIKGRKALSNSGLSKVPFGTKPLGDGAARFVADLARLKQEDSATKKRKRS